MNLICKTGIVRRDNLFDLAIDSDLVDFAAGLFDLFFGVLLLLILFLHVVNEDLQILLETVEVSCDFVSLSITAALGRVDDVLVTTVDRVQLLTVPH